MRTTLNVKDDVLRKVMKMTRAKTQTEAVNQVLEDWIRQKKLMKLRELRGKLSWEGDLGELRKLDTEGSE